MQICIHRKDNSPKPVNHRLTLKEGPKIKSNNIRRFPAHDFLRVGFTLQTSRINNKRVISTFRFGHPRLMLKEGLKVKSDHIKRFPAHNSFYFIFLFCLFLNATVLKHFTKLIHFYKNTFFCYSLK